MKITVVGLGVIGGSFVKALKGQGYEVYGIDTDQKTLDMAKEEGCIIEGYLDGKDIIPETDLTIICLYPSLVLDFIKNNQFKSGSIVTDAVGIKSYFLREALSIIPEDVEYISVHPMAGREKKGYQYASKKVFENANFIIVYHDDNKKSTIDFVQEFSKQLGFRSVKIMSPEAHDEIISFTSQLPHCLAVSLMNSDDQKYETGKYIGDSFRDLTRIANINEDLWDELFMNNKQYLLASIERFEEQLDLLKNAIRDNDDETLKAAFRKSTKRREHL
ncbi:prephenate dehydrogenase [uncultured Catenibacterium sp.]|uniref:prephenate dehydrogenase n=1 Tax=uncultured Catenibacterium sp. TaxID=286142 RepID=UPI0025D5AF79|nr:prephenate dehydrogenase [uncultured Catenibacterium sp.]